MIDLSRPGVEGWIRVLWGQADLPEWRNDAWHSVQRMRTTTKTISSSVRQDFAELERLRSEINWFEDHQVTILSTIEVMHELYVSALAQEVTIAASNRRDLIVESFGRVADKRRYGLHKRVVAQVAKDYGVTVEIRWVKSVLNACGKELDSPLSH